MDTFKHQLSRLPFMAALILAVAGMPTDVFAYNQREVGHAHSAPWRQRACAAIADAASKPFNRLLTALRSPALWRYALPAAAVLIAWQLGHLDATTFVGIAGLTTVELRAERKKLADQADEILDKARSENRDLTGEEEKKFDDIHADIDKLAKRIEREERQDAVTASLNASQGRRSEPNQTEHRGSGGRHTGQVTERDRDEAMRAWFISGAAGEEISDERRSAAQRCGVNLASKNLRITLAPSALRADTQLANGMWVASREAMAEWEKRAQSVGTGSAGGFTVPDETMRALEVSMLAFGGMRTVATVVRTGTGAALPVPTVNDNSNKGEIIGENTTTNAQDLTFAQIVLDAYKYSSKYILVSVEFLQDSSINVAEFIGKALGTRIARITNDHFTTGTGSSQPNGIVTAAGSGVTGAADPPTYAHIVDLLHSVDPEYRTGAKWMMHDSTLKSIKKIQVPNFSGQTDGPPLWQPGLVLGQPDTILGYQYVINQSMAVPGSTAKKIVFGALDKYLIRDVRDVTLLRLDERFAELHQVAFLAFSRHDGDLLDAGTDPVKFLQQT